MTPLSASLPLRSLVSGTASSAADAASPTAGAESAAEAESGAGAGTRADASTGRLQALDAARGLAIFVMLVTMNPCDFSDRPEQFTHPTWHGLHFIDLFFPLFLFAMGVSMTLSSRGLDMRHMLRRAGLLFALGVALATLKHERLFLSGVLQHIAVSYVLAFAVLRAPVKRQLAITVGLVVAVWAGFVLWAWGDDPWARGDTLAGAVDGRLFGGFRTEGTLQAVMSTATVVGGAFAGRLLQRARRDGDLERLVRGLLVRAAGMIGLALLLAPFVPVNKRLWSPSFTVLTLGTSFAFLALGTWLVDIHGHHRVVAPLVHVGTNPIAVYVMFMAALALLENHGEGLTPDLGGPPILAFIVYATVWTALWWLFAYLLYRRRIFIKV